LELEIDPDPTLPLRDLPWTDGLAFGSSQTEIMVNDHGTIPILIQSAKGT
jgi:hypothetical protein